VKGSSNSKCNTLKLEPASTYRQGKDKDISSNVTGGGGGKSGFEVALSTILSKISGDIRLYSVAQGGYDESYRKLLFCGAQVPTTIFKFACDRKHAPRVVKRERGICCCTVLAATRIARDRLTGWYPPTVGPVPNISVTKTYPRRGYFSDEFGTPKSRAIESEKRWSA
jgi:hypothetical protein